jgi:hypothetical protein
MGIIGHEGGTDQGIAVVGDVSSTASKSTWCHEVCESIQKVFAHEQSRLQ